MSYSTNYPRYNVRKYFETVASPDIFNEKSVLDFGCNRANFLRFGTQNQSSYTGVDIDSTIIAENKAEFISDTFIYYDGYNEMYNPTGIAPIPDFSNHDIGIVYSIANHMRLPELKNTINHLNQFCDHLYVTFFSSDNRAGYDLACRHRDLSNTNWSTYSSKNYSYFTAPNNLMWSFFDASYLQTETGANSVLDEPDMAQVGHTLSTTMKCLVFDNS